MMLDTISLDQSITRVKFKEEIKPLRIRLAELQHRVKNEEIPVLILFEGWGAAGKGILLSDILLTLDPRNFKTKNTLPPTAEEQRKPYLWRHWGSLPQRGILGIYDRAWYAEVVAAYAEGKLARREFRGMLREINTFERQLTDDGTVIIKLFLHITKQEQKLRLDKLAAKKSTAWRVGKHDYQNNKNYNNLYTIYNDLLSKTNIEAAPWHPVCSMDRRTALVAVYHIIIANLEQALAARERADKPSAGKPTGRKEIPLTSGEFSLIQMPTLAEVHLGKSLERDDYKAKLKKLRGQLRKLHNELYQRKIPVVIAYEGWDAAGKGGNIKRLTSALDPRGYEVVPIASPTPPERARHYLWRFWTCLQKDGHITIFDRSWYGRVLVERVEEISKKEDWQRAYREINEFEDSLHQWGAIVLKFWLHIDKDEQLARFNAREERPDKQWKITGEDWRNREKWNVYETAANDMIRLTSTSFAPWTIVESQNKLYGRIKTMETLVAAIENRL